MSPPLHGQLQINDLVALGQLPIVFEWAGFQTELDRLTNVGERFFPRFPLADTSDRKSVV